MIRKERRTDGSLRSFLEMAEGRLGAPMRVITAETTTVETDGTTRSYSDKAEGNNGIGNEGVGKQVNGFMI